MLDTASSQCLINLSFISKNLPKMKLTPSNLGLKMASTEATIDIPFRTKLNLRFQYNHRKTYMTLIFYVIPELCTDIILGSTFFKHHNFLYMTIDAIYLMIRNKKGYQERRSVEDHSCQEVALEIIYSQLKPSSNLYSEDSNRKHRCEAIRKQTQTDIMTQLPDFQNKVQDISGQSNACDAACMTNMSSQSQGGVDMIPNDGIIIYAANSSLEMGYQSEETSLIDRSQSIPKVSGNMNYTHVNSHELHGIFEDFEVEKKDREILENEYNKHGNFGIPVDKMVDSQSLDYLDKNPKNIILQQPNLSGY